MTKNPPPLSPWRSTRWPSANISSSTVCATASNSGRVKSANSVSLPRVSTSPEHHGGRVEKYIGDAIMAVFGLPRLHEDDALRAVRAALAMQDALRALNTELEERWGVRLENRTGVNTGEVIAGDATSGQRLV